MNRRIYKCQYCNNQFTKYYDFEKHQSSCIVRNTLLNDIKLLDSKWICSVCGEKFTRRYDLKCHKKSLDHYKVNNGSNRLKSEYTCPFCNKEWLTYSGSYKLHIKHCQNNPDRIPGNSHIQTQISRKKISESMKKAHAEGRAHTWDNTVMSYPEGWFTTVINDRFNDKDYHYNFRVGKYRLDFAWPKKMRYIEIDGDQHYRFESQRKSDEARTEFLKSQGWTELRLSWSYISSHKEECILSMKSFIDDVSDLPLELQYKDKRKEWYLEKEKRKAEREKLRLQKKLEREQFLKISKEVKNKNNRRKPRHVIDPRKNPINIQLLNKILNSGIDFTEFKWKHNACMKLEMSKRVIDRIVKLFPEEFMNARKDAHCKSK